MTFAKPDIRTPNWDLEQLEVILAPPTTWQLVSAGPGAGKSAVACQRVAYLVDEAIPPSRILLVSFTRTAVSELRDRIVSYAVAGDIARSVRISTIDSHAWSLRTGFDDDTITKSFNNSYDLGIQRTIELFRNNNADLNEFMGRFEHLIIDEAQDVMGLRADLVLEILKRLTASCGVTILADPAQAIYGFTTDSGDDSVPELSLLHRLPAESPRPFLQRTLANIHRVNDDVLVNLFINTRKEIELRDSSQGHVSRVQKTIRDTCGSDIGVTSHEDLAEFLARQCDGSTLVLFRRRADVLLASSYCSQAGVEHRLRMSDVPTIVKPWLGWLFGETVQAILGRQEFDKLWDSRGLLAPAPFVGEERDACWALLHHLAAASRPNTLDLVHLRNLVARARPPLELCYPEFGSSGPILGTIHASKGREADTVVLVLPSHPTRADREFIRDSAAILEEGRVYYVGATRARKTLATAGNPSTNVGYLESGRVYRIFGEKQAQLEVGRDGDIDKLAHLAWSCSPQAQRSLANHVGRTVPVSAWAVAEENYSLHVLLEQKDADSVTRVIHIGQLSQAFRSDLGKVWGRIDSESKLKPTETIRHLYLMAVGTVGLSETERSAVKSPFSHSALALAPVVKGFPMIHFFSRKGGRLSR